MTFASVTNILLMLLCVGVLVQSVRLMRSVRAVRTGDLGDTVRHLDRATDQARDVLAELKRLLATDGQSNARALAQAETLRDELSVMVGIGNAVAERIMAAAETANGEKKVEVPADDKPAPVRVRAKRTRGGRGRTPKTARKDEAVMTPVEDAPAGEVVALLPHLSKAA